MQDNRRFLYWGLTAFLVVLAVLLACDLLFFHWFIPGVFTTFKTAIAPAITGIGLAYLLTPIVNTVERLIFRRKAGDPVRWYSRTVGILAAWLLVGLVIYGVVSILLPELIASVTQLVNNAEDYYHETYSWLNRIWSDNPKLVSFLSGQFSSYFTAFENWITTTVIPQAQQVFTLITGSVVAIVNFLYNFLIGIIVSIYLLSTKEHFSAALRKLAFSWLKESDARLLLKGATRANSIFSGFIRGKLLDSLIIGVLCFFFARLFHFPYAPLISVVVGVTNVIPFFGPFLGAIPSALLILLVDPLQCLYFILFIFALQQFDGNILGPMILGDSTGLNSFWVIVAILVGGAFFGVPGMFLGVPVFACIYTAIHFFASRRLGKKGLPTELEDYADGKPILNPTAAPAEKAPQQAAPAEAAAASETVAESEQTP